MKAYQIDVLGNITNLEEEPTGPDQNRIKEIIRDALNMNGYSFKWESALSGQSRRQPYHGTLSDGNTEIDLLIYAWRISNEGEGRADLHGKRIQIGSVANNGFQRPITEIEKTLLLGVYERDLYSPIIAAWDVERNKERGQSKSCFVKLNDFVKARRTGFYSSEDASGNPVFAMIPEYLTAYVEQMQANAFSRPDDFQRNVHRTSVKRAVTSAESILTRIAGLTETEKQVLANQRVGHSAFKDLLMVTHGERCCVCGLDFPALLIGSHIKQWSKSDDQEKLDGNNGLLLCVMHDALFDKFLISFEDDGKIIYSDLLPQKLLEFLNLTEDTRINVLPLMKPYLKWHREKLRRSENNAL